MRFLADGPNIPDALLEERDNGNVVFFCGAGVSRPAGLPGFDELAHKVIQKFGTQSHERSRVLLERIGKDPLLAPPLDQVFNLLQQEYGVDVVNAEISRILKTPLNANLEPHSIILRLSKNANQRVQLVTTNFDLLFERVQKSLKQHVPPALPDLASGQPLEGIVYLHGRRTDRQKGDITQQRLVVSSADFGRAYLADGWATRFVRDLLRNYVIVLLGYSATDPPVRYLLEGLHSRGDAQSATIYAFDQGTEPEVQERWRHRGVRPIAYLNPDNDYSALWNTLREWANRADDPDAWRRSVVNLARQGPRKLQSFQRGQVASLVTTIIGAKAFADADPPPPAEWICVFDNRARYARPTRPSEGQEGFDPLDYYGLDSDPARQPGETAQASPGGVDFISVLPSDDRAREYVSLSGVNSHQLQNLPSRLIHIARWAGKIIDDPTLAWWAAGYHTLHPLLLHQINFRLSQHSKVIHDLARRVWILLLESFDNAPKNDDDLSWPQFVERQKKEGWSNQVLRSFAQITVPCIKIERSLMRKPHPPIADWDELGLSDIVDLEVSFLELSAGELNVQNETLPHVFRILRRGLEQGAAMLSDIDTHYWRTNTFYPEKASGERYLDDVNAYLLCAKEFFDRLAVEYPELARGEVTRWPKSDNYFFDKLRIYALAKPGIFSGKEAAEELLALSEDGFWYTYHRRELLFTLRARWAEFSDGERRRLEERIINGSSQWPAETEENHKQRISITAATTLGWLEKQNCRLSSDATDLLPKFRSADTQWRSSWDESAADSHESNARFVQTNDDPSVIITAPLCEILSLVQEKIKRTITETIKYDPFQGLVKKRPLRALAALSYGCRIEKYPVNLWSTLISHWPKDASIRLNRLAAQRIARLPTDVISSLAHEVSGWVRDNFGSLHAASAQGALLLWDQILDKLIDAGAEANRSAIGEIKKDGVKGNRSRRTYEHAINSPIGKMTEALLEVMPEMKKPKNKSEIPGEYKSRLERLFLVTGEGSDYAVSEATLYLRWLFYFDPVWTCSIVIPFFNLDNPKSEPAWSGYLHDNHLVPPKLFLLLKPHFLNLFDKVSVRQWFDLPFNRLVEFLIIACFWNQRSGEYLSFDETRIALQKIDDADRAHAAWFLSRIVSEQGIWKSFGKAFIEKAWPRERRFQSANTSSQLALLAENAGVLFPDVVRTIAPYLVPVEHLDVHVHRFERRNIDTNIDIAEKYPEALLRFLDRLTGDDVRSGIYGLESVLEKIAETKPYLRQDVRWRRLRSIIGQW